MHHKPRCHCLLHCVYWAGYGGGMITPWHNYCSCRLHADFCPASLAVPDSVVRRTWDEPPRPTTCDGLAGLGSVWPADLCFLAEHEYNRVRSVNRQDGPWSSWSQLCTQWTVQELCVSCRCFLQIIVGWFMCLKNVCAGSASGSCVETRPTNICHSVVHAPVHEGISCALLSSPL